MSRENFLYLFCGAVLGLIAGTILLGPLVADLRRGSASPAPEVATAPAAAPSGTAEMAVMQRVMEEIEQLKGRLESNPRDVDAMIGLGNLYMDARKYDDAISWFEGALALRDDPDVKTDLGLCYRGRGDIDRALRTFREVRSADPTHFAARYNEALVLFTDLKRPAEARAIVEQLKIESQEDPAVGRFEQALAAAGG